MSCPTSNLVSPHANLTMFAVDGIGTVRFGLKRTSESPFVSVNAPRRSSRVENTSSDQGKRRRVTSETGHAPEPESVCLTATNHPLEFAISNSWYGSPDSSRNGLDR